MTESKIERLIKKLDLDDLTTLVAKAKIAAKEKQKQEQHSRDIEIGKLVRQYSRQIFESKDLPEEFTDRLREFC